MRTTSTSLFLRAPPRTPPPRPVRSKSPNAPLIHYMLLMVAKPSNLGIKKRPTSNRSEIVTHGVWGSQVFSLHYLFSFILILSASLLHSLNLFILCYRKSQSHTGLAVCSLHISIVPAPNKKFTHKLFQCHLQTLSDIPLENYTKSRYNLV